MTKLYGVLYTEHVATRVVITGSGVPHVQAGRAGAGVLVTHEKIRLQFDAGRATTLRLAEAGVAPRQLSALFITHHHSDHLTGLTDVLFTRWLESHGRYKPLTVVAPRGPAISFLEHMFDPWSDDIEIRRAHTGRTDSPSPIINAFDIGDDTVEVWRHPDADVRVLARAVHHEPVSPSVAYRVETPDGAMVFSGDTRVCDEVGELARGAQVLVHEAMRKSVMREFAETAPHFGHIMQYHSDVIELGAMAEKFNVPHLVLTHLIPAPQPGTDEENVWVDDVRAGGYTGQVTVARDLTSCEF